MDTAGQSESGRQKVSVSYIFRKPDPRCHFSLERLFGDIRRELPRDIEPHAYVCRCSSRGLVRRLLIVLEAAAAQGKVTHVTGDITFAAALMRRRSTVLTIPDLHWINDCLGVTKLLRRFIWVRMPVARARFVTVISQATKRDLLAICPGDSHKIRVIPCCVSPAFVHDARPFPDESPTVLQVGTRPNKNLERVAKALRGMDCHFRIVGALTPAQRSLLASNGINYSNVVSVSDAEMVEEYRRADLLVFASLSEGFGMPIVEAQAMGRVVVTSGVAPMTDVAGAGAVFVDPGDEISIRRGIAEVFANPGRRSQLIEAGLRNAERFSARSIAAEYAELYREAVNSR
jgi:glycosyltransferase involved in cell wall biosynthesis